ncbi:MAG: hypothetical protein LBS40_07145, partial [Burkholderiales bacterium]|nr:hypothetical protein [Burkholderiales bacterium]
TAQAATITVNSSAGTLTDSGKCTLRGAVSSVNAGSNQNNCAAVVSPDAYGSNDTITFDTTVFSAATTITVSPEITITRSLTVNGLLDGSGDPLITLDGNSATTIFGVAGTVSLDISGLIFQNGRNMGCCGGAINGYVVNINNSVFTGNQAGFGGAIIARIASVSNSVFIGNRASVSSGGGAIFTADTVNISNSVFIDNQAGSTGGAVLTLDTANISNSTFTNNRAYGTNSYGGAIRAYNTANLSNSTFIGNHADNSGGAIVVGETLEASHLTLFDNSAGQNGAAIFMDDNSSGSIHNSLILSSVALVGASTLCEMGSNSSISGSYNIEWVNGTDTTSCGGVNNVPGGSGGIGAIVATALADNGGPTPTLALPAGSPAIGAVDPGGATSRMLVINFSPPPMTATWEDATLDQRGVARAAAAAERSLGAFEYKAPPPPPVNAAPIPVLPAPLALLLALGLAGIGFRKLKIVGS